MMIGERAYLPDEGGAAHPPHHSRHRRAWILGGVSIVALAALATPLYVSMFRSNEGSATPLEVSGIVEEATFHSDEAKPESSLDNNGEGTYQLEK